MPTPYLTRSRLESLLGAPFVTRAESSGFNVQAVIDGQCAVADGYVRKQVSLPPNAAAIEQVAPVVADLVYSVFYATANPQGAADRGQGARKQLREIAERKFILASPAQVDDPNTPENEATAHKAAMSSAPRLVNFGGPEREEW